MPTRLYISLAGLTKPFKLVHPNHLNPRTELRCPSLGFHSYKITEPDKGFAVLRFKHKLTHVWVTPCKDGASLFVRLKTHNYGVPRLQIDPRLTVHTRSIADDQVKLTSFINRLKRKSGGSVKPNTIATRLDAHQNCAGSVICDLLNNSAKS